LELGGLTTSFFVSVGFAAAAASAAGGASKASVSVTAPDVAFSAVDAGGCASSMISAGACTWFWRTATYAPVPAATITAAPTSTTAISFVFIVTIPVKRRQQEAYLEGYDDGAPVFGGIEKMGRLLRTGSSSPTDRSVLRRRQSTTK
jgi:hypothetical protein